MVKEQNVNRNVVGSTRQGGSRLSVISWSDMMELCSSDGTVLDSEGLGAFLQQ